MKAIDRRHNEIIDRRERREHWIESEIVFARETIGGLQKTQDQLITIAVAVIAGALSVASKTDANGSREIFIALPFGLAMLAAYSIRTNTYVRALGGHRAALEDHIMPRSNFLWENDTALILKDVFGYRLTQYFVPPLLVASSIIGGVQAHDVFKSPPPCKISPHCPANSKEALFGLIVYAYCVVAAVLVGAYMSTKDVFTTSRAATTAKLGGISEAA